VFVLRTHRSPPWRRRPRVILVATVLAGVAAAAALPYTPLARPLGFTALPPVFMVVVAVMVAVYLVLVEVVKRMVMTPQDLLRPSAPPVSGVPQARRQRRVHRRAARFTTRGTRARPTARPGHRGL